jgi:hypothetical protein
VSRDLIIGDSDIGGQKGKFFNFASGEVAKESKPSIGGGQVAEIKGSRVNSEVRKVRAQRLGAPSREW